jgi:hypothetical protein
VVGLPRWLARKKMFPRGHYDRRHDMHIFNPVIDWLVPSPRAADIVFVDGTSRLTPINWLPIRGMCQSVRPAFECPRCGRNVFKLFYRDGWFSGCYRCKMQLRTPSLTALQMASSRFEHVRL